MDSKSTETRSQKFEVSSERLSAFEMALNLEFQFEAPQQGATPKAGDLCPQCRSARIDYDGLLNLSCPDCGYTLAGCFT